MMTRNIFLQILFIAFSTVIIGQEYNAFDKDGKRHGKWRKKFENVDKIRYEGTFEHGKEIGEFKFYKLDSKEFPSAVKVFSKNSDSVLMKYYTIKGGLVSEGKVIGKKRVGSWKYYHRDSDKVMMIEQYQDGILNGEQKTFFVNGQLTEVTTYLKGKRHGIRKIYSEEGKILKEFIYENDQLHGLTKYYNTKGELIIEGNYKRNRKDGIWKYYKNGKLDEEKLFPLSKNR